MSDLRGFEILSDERVGAGGFLQIRRLRLRMLRADGSKSEEGIWDYVERPVGLDAVVLALHRAGANGSVEVLLRHCLRVPLQFGRPEPAQRLIFPELVAGIVEKGDDLAQRATSEAFEETGLRVEAAEIQPLGPPMYPTPGMCAELFHFLACEVRDLRARPPAGDGSPFEEGARLEWVELGEALRRCSTGEINDMKTEIGLRRLRERLGAAG